MFNTESEAKARLKRLLMDDLPLGDCAVAPVRLSPGWFREFQAARRDFLASLSDSIPELALINLSREDFMDLLMAKRIPENLSVKFRRPIVYGGSISPENMFLMLSFPYGSNLDIFMAEQAGQGKIWYPNPEKKIYISVNMLSGGEGGNATSDRLSQAFAAQVGGRE